MVFYSRSLCVLLFICISVSVCLSVYSSYAIEYKSFVFR